MDNKVNDATARLVEAAREYRELRARGLPVTCAAIGEVLDRIYALTYSIAASEQSQQGGDRLDGGLVAAAWKMCVHVKSEVETFERTLVAAEKQAHPPAPAVAQEPPKVKGHGPCCTCQTCGKHYDDCRCEVLATPPAEQPAPEQVRTNAQGLPDPDGRYVMRHSARPATGLIQFEVV